MSTYQEQQARVEAAEREAREARSWLTFLRAHPEVHNGTSNFLISREFHNGAEITPESLEECYANPAFRKMLAIQQPPSDEQKRAEASSTIKKITGQDPKASPITKWTSTAELEAKAASLAARRELVQKTPAELRAIIQAAKPVADDSGSEMPPEMDRKYLLSLNAPGAFKKICDRYGVVAVTARLN